MRFKVSMNLILERISIVYAICHVYTYNGYKASLVCAHVIWFPFYVYVFILYLLNFILLTLFTSISNISNGNDYQMLFNTLTEFTVKYMYIQYIHIAIGFGEWVFSPLFRSCCPFCRRLFCGVKFNWHYFNAINSIVQMLTKKRTYPHYFDVYMRNTHLSLFIIDQ